MLKTGISRKAASLYSILLIILLSGFIIFFIISNLISEASDIYNALPEYYKRINSNLSVISDRLKDLNLALPQEVSVDAEKLITNISSSYIKILNSIIKVILNIAKAIPQTIIFILATILSTYFLSSDREKLLDALHRVIPQSLSVKIRNLKTDLFSALIGYLKAQLILLSITFTELLTGFILIGIKSPILLALIISFIDALPILGTGIILIPWSLYYLVTGDIRLAVSVVLIYLIVFIVRQLVEPRVISRQIGVHPIFTLFGMYIGFNLFGVTGLILGPVTVLTIKSTFVRMLKRTG
jgi:sporulation integral membrane protein YtvI